MDIVLRTHNDSYLAFRDIQRYSDQSGFCAQLVARARGFGAQLLFCVEPEAFTAFVEALEAMDRTLTGEARLKPIFEDPFIHVSVGHTGRVTVSGDLVAYGPLTQRLQFALETDQTALGPFIRDLRSCITM